MFAVIARENGRGRRSKVFAVFVLATWSTGRIGGDGVIVADRVRTIIMSE